MALSDKDFDAAYADWQQSGSYHTGPLEQRWAVFLPKATLADLQEAHQRCREIDGAAFWIADKVVSGAISEEVGREELGKDYPNLTKERLNRAWMQALHSARK